MGYSSENTKRIPLWNRKRECVGFALIDAADAESVDRYRWSLLRRKHQPHLSYAYTHETDEQGKRRCLLLHRLLLPCEGLVDHINLNGLDNRRENLRPASRSQNAANTPRHRDNESGFRGVYWSMYHNSWVVQLRVDGRRFQRRGFATPEEAARAYDDFAREHFGAFARLNFPNSPLERAAG